MTEELTPWFRGVLKPVRKGVYKRELTQSGYVGYAYWNGIVWYAASKDVETAVIRYKCNYKSSTDVAQTKWRGLANDPAAV